MTLPVILRPEAEADIQATYALMLAGINLEFARTEGLSLEAALARAAEAGYRFVEPYVYSRVSLGINSHLAVQTSTPYHHINTDDADPRRINALRRELGLAFSAVDAHATLLLPQVGVPYVCRAIDLAAEVECPIVMSDEGPVPDEWLSLAQAFDIMCVSVEAIVRHAQARGVCYAVELHNALTARPDMLAKLLERFGPGELGVNFDTGNAFLAGNDPVEYLGQVAGRVIHVHVKDIPESMLSQRGRVTGTRVGVAAGDGVVDLPGVVRVLAQAGYQGVLSVECDTLAQAQKSLSHLNRLFDREKGTGASCRNGLEGASHKRLLSPFAGRIAAVDFGTVRIGIAISDPERTVASPYENYTRRGPQHDARRFQRLVAEEKVVLFVVGLPVHGDGRESEKSQQARQFGHWLAEVTGAPVEFFDERFTSKEAEGFLLEAGMSKKRRKKRIDKVAAQILLSAYLESHRKGQEPPGPLDG